MTQVTVALPETLLIELNKMATADMRSRNGLIVKMLSEQVINYQQTNAMSDNRDIAEKFDVRPRFQDGGRTAEETPALNAPRKKTQKRRRKPEAYIDKDGTRHLPGGIIARPNPLPPTASEETNNDLSNVSGG